MGLNQKIWLYLLVFILIIGLCGGFSYAGIETKISRLNEPGSILVYPLIDNINYTTIIEITNLSEDDVWLEGYMIVHAPDSPDKFEKSNFLIHLTQKEVFWWNTSIPYCRNDE